MSTQTKTPAVSVIVPTFNRRKPLRLALDSLARQTFTDTEVIVVNDAGPDAGDIVDSFRDRLDISYVVQPKNLGQSAANNEGLRRARAQFAAVLNDDDLLAPRHVEGLVTALQSAPQAVLAYSDCRMVRVRRHDDGTMEKVDWRPYAGGPFDRGRLMIANNIPVICALFSRKAALDCGGFDERLFHYEDWDLWIRMAFQGGFVHVPRPSAEYLLNLSGAQNKSRADKYLNNIKSREYIYAKYESVFEANPVLAAARTNFWKGLFEEKSADAAFGDPSDPARLDALCRLASNAGLKTQAEDLARQRVELCPDRQSLTVLAELLNENGKHEEALACLKRSRKLS